MNKNIYIAAREVAENAKLNHEIAKELRKFKTNHQLSSSGLDIVSRWLRIPYLTWIPVSSTGMTRMYVLLSILTLLPTLAHAETCTATPDCKSLGYTETSCPSDNGVKCPWNTSLWHCDQGCAADCENLGYKYDCKSENATGGSGQSCGGKYSSCTCSSGYKWSGGKCIAAGPTQYFCCYEEWGWPCGTGCSADYGKTGVRSCSAVCAVGAGYDPKLVSCSDSFGGNRGYAYVTCEKR